MSKIWGDLERAAIEKVGALPSASVDKAKGRIVYLTTDNKTYISDGTDWHEIPVLTTEGALQLSEIATPDTPASGKMRVYPKSDNFLYSLDDTGAERKVGSGSGADTFYYEDFESGVYSAFTASGSFALANGARATTAVLDGSKEAKFTRGSSADTISWSVPIPVGYNPAIVRISFLYETDSSYADNDIEIHVLNGSTELGVVGYQLKAGKGKHICEFQTDAATADTTYTLRFKQATAGSWTNVYIDDLTVAAREIARGSVVTDWVTYTPTGSMSAGGSYYGKWRRNGDSMEGQVYFVASGAVSPAGAFTINLPSGFSIDSAKLPNSLADYHVAVGSGQVIDNTVRGYPLITYINSTTSVGFRSAETTGSSSSDVEDDSPITFGANDTLSGNFKVPIAGWSSNAVMSSDFGGRIIDFQASKGSTQAVTANTTNITFTTTVKDTVAGYNSSETYTVQESGDYMAFGGAWDSASGNSSTYVYVNGTQTKLLSTSISGQITSGAAFLPNLVKGDTVTLRQNASITLASAATFALVKVSSPQTLLGSEKVLCRVHSSSTVINSTGNVDLVFSTKSYDTHNAYSTSTGIFTSPRAGRLNIDCVFRSSGGVSALAVGDAAYLLVTNVTQSKSYWLNYLNAFTTSSIYRFLQGSIGIDVNAGDQIKIQGSRDTNHGNITGGNSEVYTWADFKMES